MGSSLYGLGIVLLGVAAAPKPGSPQTPLHLPFADRVRLAEGRQLAELVCERIWPGWGRTEFQVLLVGDSAEFLVLNKVPAPVFFGPYLNSNPFFGTGNGFAPPRRLFLTAGVSF